MKDRTHDSTGWLAFVIWRDGPVCYICHQGPDEADPWEVDHVRPKVAGGRTDEANLRLTHESCNATKGRGAVAE